MFSYNVFFNFLPGTVYSYLQFILGSYTSSSVSVIKDLSTSTLLSRRSGISLRFPTIISPLTDHPGSSTAIDTNATSVTNTKAVTTITAITASASKHDCKSTGCSEEKTAWEKRHHRRGDRSSRSFDIFPRSKLEPHHHQ